MTPKSAATTARIVEYRKSGLSWGQIATREGISRSACQQRYARVAYPSERQQRKHAEALVVSLQAEIRRLRARIAALEA